MLNKTFSIFNSRSFLLSIPFLLSACSGHSPSGSSPGSPGQDGEYIGWHCQGEIKSGDNWNCSEELLKGGELVSPIQAEPETVEVLSSKVDSSKVDSSEVDSSKLDSSEVDEIALDLSAPETELALDENIRDESVVGKNIVDETAADESTADESAVDKNTAGKALAEKILTFDISAKGFTVQLGAYLSQKMAEQAADNIHLTEGELRVRDIADGERYLFVLVYGQYPSREQAEVAVEQLIELNPGLNYWIRTIKSMRERD
jgi:septal ring-binding cell division protein DamX